MAFSTKLLDQKLAQIRQQNERDRQRLLAKALSWLQQNGERFGICGGYLFGSMTQPGRFTQHSDLDLAVETLAVGNPFGLSSYLSTDLDRDVDIVPLDQCHFADKIRQTGLQWSTKR
ncbi:MAG: nucleotidyltransferase domain-containing protein [Leptolyngbya sp. SIO4C5]|nr:nucleotidyltransferase domain-containing protein [Leptolyngbya sp. SIO4C5]